MSDKATREQETGWLVATNQKSEQIVKCCHHFSESEQRVDNFLLQFSLVQIFFRPKLNNYSSEILTFEKSFRMFLETGENSL